MPNVPPPAAMTPDDLARLIEAHELQTDRLAAATHQLRSLARLVAEMRRLQTLYFQTKSPAVLADAKRTEKTVDAAVADLIDVYTPNPQRNLF